MAVGSEPMIILSGMRERTQLGPVGIRPGVESKSAQGVRRVWFKSRRVPQIALLLIPFLLCGCAIEKFNAPPTWASAVTTHSRFFGLNADIPAGNSSVFKIQLGWGSQTLSVIPVSTNKVYAAPISDTFKLGQEINPFNTVITEDLVSGWEGTPPTPRHLNLFLPPK